MTKSINKSNAAALSAINAVFNKTKVAAKVEQSIPAAAVAEATEAADIDGLMARFAQAQSALLAHFNAPGWKRTLCAIITYIVGVSGVIAVSTALTEWLFVGAIAASAPMFIAIAVAILAAVLLAWYGHALVLRVTGAILTKEADERAVAAYDAVKNLARRFNPFVKLVPAAA